MKNEIVKIVGDVVHLKFRVKREVWDVMTIDLEDLERVSKHGWCGQRNGSVRLRAQIGKKNVRLHRFILGVTDPTIKIDHINGDTLNNCKSNLRVCSIQENAFNSTLYRKNNTSGYKGVAKHGKKWRAYVVEDNKQRHLGSFVSKENAARAYNKAALALFGRFARLNVIES